MTIGDLVNIDQSTEIIYKKIIKIHLKRASSNLKSTDNKWGKPQTEYINPVDKSEYKENNSDITIQVSSTTKQTGRFKVFI
jgi:hypothetical protein